MAILLGLDFETTGLDPKTDKIIEAGMCLWDTERGPLEMKSYIIRQDVTLSSDIIRITGITQEMLEFGHPEGQLILDLQKYTCADYLVAHNAPFDAAFLPPLFERHAQRLPEIKWIDTLQDIPAHVGKRLTHAAAEEGMLNPFPHRALPDVLTMLTLLSKFDFAAIERNATTPSRRLMIRFPYSAEKVALVKSLGGWKWDGDEREWFMNCKEFLVQQEVEKAKAAGFQVFAYEQEGVA
jgi:DNA polymerase-3 subunit epsilon